MNCITCGVEIQPPRRKFCSVPCGYKNWYRRKGYLKNRKVWRTKNMILKIMKEGEK